MSPTCASFLPDAAAGAAGWDAADAAAADATDAAAAFTGRAFRQEAAYFSSSLWKR